MEGTFNVNAHNIACGPGAQAGTTNTTNTFYGADSHQTDPGPSWDRLARAVAGLTAVLAEVPSDTPERRAWRRRVHRLHDEIDKRPRDPGNLDDLAGMIDEVDAKVATARPAVDVAGRIAAATREAREACAALRGHPGLGG